MRKVKWALLMGLALVLTGLTALSAQETFQGYPVIRLTLNGQPVESDVPAVNFHGRTVVPLRALAELLGLDVEFDAATNTVHLRSRPGSEQAVGGGPGAAAAAQAGADSPKATPAAQGTRVQVTRVVDGDTLQVTRLAGPPLPSDRVRLIGVDTPESTTTVEPFGKEASQYTTAQLLGRTVWLTKDVSDTDRYGRALRYVWMAEPPPEPTLADVQQTMFNAVLLLEGVAKLLTYPPDVHFAAVFQGFEQAAREAGRGLWGQVGVAGVLGTAGTAPPASAPAVAQVMPAAPSAPTTPPSVVGPNPTIPTVPALRYDPQGPDRDCPDFATQAEAQAFFIAAGGPELDPHRLDSDKDGVPCESLP